VKSNSKLIIIFSFSIVLILLGIIISVSVSSNSKIIQEGNKITGNNTVSHLVFNMRDAAHRRSLLLYRIVFEPDSFVRDDMWMEYKNEAQSFINATNLLKEKNLPEDVQFAFDDALKSSSISYNLQELAVGLILDGKTEEAYTILNNDIIPAQDEVMASLTDLLIAVRVLTDDHITYLNDSSQESNLVISSLGALALFLGALITIYVTRKITSTEKTIVEKSELADQANYAKSMFLANMSHEIRSPLTTIMGFSKSILTRSMTSQKKLEFTQNIVRNAEHLYDIINDILDLSKIEAGQLQIETVVTPLAKILGELESIVGIPAQKKGLQFNMHYDFPIPSHIETDPTRLKQVLVNLTSNAMKFTESGDIDVIVSFSQADKKVRFCVIDTGIGMSKEQMKHIFSAFSQADISTTRKFGGTGLGLTISRQLCEKLGGKLECESQIGTGSNFYFEIDVGNNNNLKMVDNINLLEFEDDNTSNTEQLSLKGHVLVAEDTVDNQRLIEMYVTDTGATVSIVENGLEAVKICESEKFDLVLMDMQMPIMGGIEATQKIRQQGIGTPIVSLTANVMQSDIDKCLTAGANDFLSKPIDLDAFNHTLTKFLAPQTKAANDEQPKLKENRLQKIKLRFLNDLPNRVKLINDAINENNWKLTEEETHKLKGLGDSMDHPKITEICGLMNKACIENNYEPISNLLHELNQYTQSISK